MDISIAGLKKEYLQGKNKIVVLSDLSLDIKSGEICALLGKSGSGKSTILSLMSGLDRPDAGHIKIGQKDITKLNEQELCAYRAHDLGIIFQQFHLVPHLSALENVSLSLEIAGSPDISKARDFLSAVGLSERIHHYPAMLSGGEQQRVALARAMVNHPPLILADEPTGNLDVETGKTVADLLFNLARKQKSTMVIVTHDEELAQRADRIITLKDGKCHF